MKTVMMNYKKITEEDKQLLQSILATRSFILSDFSTPILFKEENMVINIDFSLHNPPLGGLIKILDFEVLSK